LDYFVKYNSYKIATKVKQSDKKLSESQENPFKPSVIFLIRLIISRGLIHNCNNGFKTGIIKCFFQKLILDPI